jgi:hypothetical protein
MNVMRQVNVDNFIEGIDNISLSYNHETRNFDFLIGKTVRGRNMFKIGVIVSIDYYKDYYGHSNVVAVLDNGRRMNCRKMGLK